MKNSGPHASNPAAESSANALPKGWFSGETAPRDGQVILTYWGLIPTFAAWSDGQPARFGKRFPWSPLRETERRVEPGFRCVFWIARSSVWGADGGRAPFMPRWWMPIPAQPLVAVS